MNTRADEINADGVVLAQLDEPGCYRPGPGGEQELLVPRDAFAWNPIPYYLDRDRCEHEDTICGMDTGGCADTWELDWTLLGPFPLTGPRPFTWPQGVPYPPEFPYH